MKPTIGLLLGDRNGIGPEIAAKLLARADTTKASAVAVIGDPEVFAAGQRAAGVEIATETVDDPADIKSRDVPIRLVPFTTGVNELTPGQVSAEAGREVLDLLVHGAKIAEAGHIDGLVFAPLNKQAMHEADLAHEDEMQYLKHELAFDGMVGELNVLDNLWTSRVTSHVPLKAVADLITGDGIVDAIELLHGAVGASGITKPRLAVCGLNPHAGDGGAFGREEIDVIAPAIKRAKEAGINAQGPFPCDTVFVRAKEGEFDAVVTMYHDQGQIAMKLMGFGRGVTVLGGLPVVITTAAHGTAYDIAGQGIAREDGLARAFELCRAMALAKRL